MEECWNSTANKWFALTVIN